MPGFSQNARIIDTVAAINSLVPNALCIIIDNVVTDWQDERPQPTNAEVQNEITRLQADYDDKQYQRDRKLQYPPIQDVVVALAEKEEGDDTMWQEITAKRAKVKADNPKPE